MGRFPYRDVVSMSEFTDTIHASDTYSARTQARKEYIDGSLERLHRVFNNILNSPMQLAGPTLDVASGWGILYPAIKRFAPAMTPYSIAEMTDPVTVIDGDTINGSLFECEKDILNFPDHSFGTVLFIDTLEHLLVDPMWTLLEFNRVLRPGGHLVVSTPNAICANKIVAILQTANPATESHYKPTALYQRHNREWTPNELANGMWCAGFDDMRYSTNHQELSWQVKAMVRATAIVGVPLLRVHELGPELFMVGEKAREATLQSNLPLDKRFPPALYSSYDAYRRRPEVFPIRVGKDYS